MKIFTHPFFFTYQKKKKNSLTHTHTHTHGGERERERERERESIRSTRRQMWVTTPAWLLICNPIHKSIHKEL
jgi:hypothetical protein